MRAVPAAIEVQGRRLADDARASSVFANLRTLLPAAAHNTLSDLEDICGEARQLLRAGAVAIAAAGLAVAAHSAFASVDFARSGACGDGAAVLG